MKCCGGFFGYLCFQRSFPPLNTFSIQKYIETSGKNRTYICCAFRMQSQQVFLKTNNIFSQASIFSLEISNEAFGICNQNDNQIQTIPTLKLEVMVSTDEI